jgi:uncharacterized protein YndB with AHSA1/START domain
VAESASGKTGANDVGMEVTITRVFDAPRDLVFKVWTDAKHVKQWWGPNFFTVPKCEIDAREGGDIYIVMRAPDGSDYPMSGKFVEIVRPERIVFTSAAIDPAGKPLFEVHNTITFVAEGKKTRLTMHARVTSATAEAPRYLQGMEQGWSETLQRLGAYVANLSEA